MIFERVDNPKELQKFDRLGEKLQLDVLALRHLMALGRGGAFDYLISPRSLREFELTKGSKRVQLVSWGRKVRQYSLGVLHADGETARTRLLRRRSRIIAESQLLSFLPEELDRHLVADAFCLRADAFLTTDYRTVLRHRRKLRKLGIQALSPESYSRLWKPLEALYI
jgi:hypothetical protein